MNVLFFSDIHSDLGALRRLIDIEADYYFCAGDLVSWARGLDQVGEILKAKAGRMLLIPGNHESETDISAFCDQYGFENMHGRTRSIGGVQIAALGYSNPTPFNTPGEYSEAQIEARLAMLASPNPQILVCHCPPKGTPLDLGGGGRHFGSTAVANFIDQVSPRYFLCGHIHEAEGVQVTLGSQFRTTGVNVGKQGFLLDLSSI